MNVLWKFSKIKRNAIYVELLYIYFLEKIKIE